jgi:hypothetical protein
MRAVWLLPFLFAAPAAAQLAVPAAQARNALAGFAAARDARQAAALAAYGLTPETVEVRCGGKPCPGERRREVLAALAGMLGRMPKLVAPARPPKLVWEDLPAGAPSDGTSHGDGAITLYAPAGKDMGAILAHELAHTLEFIDRKTVAGFMALRHDTPAYRDALAAFWVEVWRSRGPEDDDSRPLSPRARQMLGPLRLPRRHADDLHAAKSGREYWAVSVELVYLEWSAGKAGDLSAFMTAEEEAYLRSRF